MAQSQLAGGAAPAWRQFPFFDVVPVKDAHDLGSSPEIFQKTPEISTTVASSVGLIVADIHGSVYLVDRDFEIGKAWVAHVGGRVTHMAERRGILITLGEEDAVRHPLLKVWDLQAFDKKTGAPLLLRAAKVQSGNRPHPVSTIALSATLAYLAIGLGDGTVILYRHLDQSVFSTSGSLSTLPKPRVIHESSTEPVTGLGFREPSDDSPNIYLFIVTIGRVLCYQASGKGNGAAPISVDEIGAGLGCANMDWKAREVVVARDEAIYLCGTESRGACFAYEGLKSRIHTYRNYIVIISPPFAPTATAASATVRNFVAKNVAPAGSEITKVTVFDLENKFVAYTGTFMEGVREIFSVWGKLYVLSNDGKLMCLEEKPTSTKLDMLYRKGLYVLALNIAETQQLDEAHVADIHKQYGDHLYTKGDYDGAMQQYIQTMRYVQPSYVIRKFLDAQRIHNLVTYLQELHSLGLANSDHTTLLLNTYTKLKDVSRLDSFIKRESLRTTGDGDKDELPFDLDTAIRVCRQAGYFEHASYLAKKYERHEDYLRIQIEDAGNYKDALLYLRRLGAEAAESNLARYGRAMLENLPEETTDLLIDLCTSLSPLTVEPEQIEIVSTRQQQSGGPSYLSYLALNRVSTAGLALPSDAAPSPSQPEPPRDPAKEPSQTPSPSDATPETTTPVKAPPPTVKRPSPRLYFAHFVDHPNHFIRFLETVARKRWGQALEKSGTPLAVGTDPNADEQAEQADQVAVWNTLFELYLSRPGADPTTHTDTKALAVLENTSLPYDTTHALILCSTRAFTPGLVLLWERLGMHEDVVRFFIDRHGAGDAGASAEVVRRLAQYGPGRAQLYPLVLRFLTSTPALLAKHRRDVAEVLRVIDAENIMPPVSVVQLLSRNDVASVGLVKEWLMQRIQSAREEVETDQQLIMSYRLETQAKVRQVEELADPDRPHVFHVSQCSACQGGLDLPAVHFMCNHSYHQRCLPQNETECPNCAREHGMIREIRRNHERLADQHDLFVSEVREGGFSALAGGFGRGTLNMARVDDVTA
ncbi:uncharacterized protein BXZ73DRAFT_93587 [Epithele typhae]|uniref:uncharacterized protein n=1 Tax=Epithele typhae TaxID=378194 RepID=UPI00200728A5|nr:uncharacterized protein BXZ73DRAFT_93587 [Epithele typhae]KAH9910785.1 hypothetical protein BXZ73DRAFT_93587 [Epithele typhae]